MTEYQMRTARPDVGEHTAGGRIDHSIQDIFGQVARAYPARPAIVCEQRVITYAELESWSDGFARVLRNKGIGAGGLVGLFIHRSPEAIMAMLGILKAGAAFVPLDPAYPHEHLSFIAGDANPSAVVSASRMFESLAEPKPWTCQTILIDAEVPPLESEYGRRLDAGGRDDVACVMYTSGTTGRPKGVLIPHRGVVRLARNTYIDLSPEDVVLHMATLAFDASTFEIFSGLLNGAALAILPSVRPSFSEIADVIARHGVTTALLTTSLFHAVVDHHLDALRPLRQLITGGDVLSPRHARQMMDAIPGCRLINAYGPTENSTITCCYTLPRNAPPDAPAPIGRPIAHTQIYVLDEERRPVPQDEIGELFAAGEGVALGYLNQPELTTEKFAPDIFGADANARMYRTGDLVRRRADGIVEFVGRADRQVKISGKRVELEEVEAAMRRLPYVADAVAQVRDRGEAQRQIVAYAAGRDGARLDAALLRQQMLQIAPSYMTPAHIFVLDALPLTPSGKVDRNALPDFPSSLDAAPDAGAGVDPAPKDREQSGDVESTLAEICRRLLKLPHVGLDANFFDLGGTSLDLMALHEEIRARFQQDLPVTTLFEYTNIRALAARLAQKDSAKLPIAAMNARKLQQNEALRKIARTRNRTGE
ncbi:non-ribosomal peptide synthetase [Methylocapsa palsarum]|uniref:Amino acid adenylation domain-containing protein n=1 Tax=Methylocapsa palsarum TaxID=1612308 RepID=A0A1I3XIM5_9HYPH|nr:non-ribosomal peptide synthetase [Methylocapsa palsarum]SFK19189.1 amino acid adenylation domain-containing protein [Methylocapsa palsarum]